MGWTRRARRNRRGLAVGVILTAVLSAGAVAVTAAPAGATAVASEPALRAAFAADASVELVNDITLEDCTGGGALERTSLDPVVLDGQGFTLTQRCSDNAVVQENVGAGLVTIQNITITGGSAGGSGGGVFAQGDLMIINSVFRGNHANQFGGAMATDGELNITSSLIDDNNASMGGGGIAANLILNITSSTVSNNLGGGAAAAASDQAAITVTNSTVTGNSQAGNGAGLFSGGSVTLVYATVADNVAQVAFDNIQTGTGLTSFASVVVGGSAERLNCLDTDDNTSLGYNYSDDESCGFTRPTDRQAQPVGSALLGPLGDNGGPTPTRVPGPGSPLIDAIPVAACQDDGASGITTDQRGVSRPQGPGCDIGAVEVEVVVPEPIVIVPTFTG